MNVATTANSLSQSNYFNLFVILLDALIVVIYDVNRSKYVMMVKKRKREILEVSPSKEYKLKRLWICVAVTFFLGASSYITEKSFNFFSRIQPKLDQIVVGIMGGISICCYLVILYFSSGSKATSTLYRLMHERRVIFIVLLLGVLFYVDNIYLEYWTVGTMIFPIMILLTVSYDLVVMYFPRRMGLVMIILVVLLLCWNIFYTTFLRKDCKEYMLPWGIFGEKISICTIKRLIYQSIFSLIVSAAIAIFAGRADNLFFCNANIYRSTGTINKHTRNEKYTNSMKTERDCSGIIMPRSMNEMEMISASL